MVQEKSQRLADLAEQLSAALMTAAICADEIRAIAQAELDRVRKSQAVATEAATLAAFCEANSEGPQRIIRSRRGIVH